MHLIIKRKTADAICDYRCNFILCICVTVYCHCCKNKKLSIYLPKGSVLAPMLFNIYPNDQPVHADTGSFIYADDLCFASQGNDSNNIEAPPTSDLSTMTTYYDTNQLRANPSKTQVCAFHLRNREAKREPNVV